MKDTLVLILLFMLSTLLSAQPAIQWQKALGGNFYDEGYFIHQTTDGGYIATGIVLSNNGDVSGNNGTNDFWAVKLDNLGNLVWQHALGGDDTDWPFSAQLTSDGGSIIVGFTQSNNGDVSGNHGDKDVWVVKLDSEGNLQWQKALGGSLADLAWTVSQTQEGGYIIAGETDSNDGDVMGGTHGGSIDYWVVKLSPTGLIEWQKTYGGDAEDVAYSIRQTLDGGYVMAGTALSDNGDVTNQRGNGDYWIVKLDSIGTIEWQKAYGSIGYDRANSVYQTPEGGYVVLGEVSHNSGDVTGFHGGVYDWWALKLGSKGEILWKKTYGGSEDEWGRAIRPTGDGGYILAGMTSSSDGDVTGYHGENDAWLVKLDAIGVIQWQKTLGGSSPEWGHWVEPTDDGGYVLCGYAMSNDGDVSGVHGFNDIWVVKLGPETIDASEAEAQRLSLYPNPASYTITIQIPDESPDFLLSVCDPLGRELLRQHVDNGRQVPVSSLPGGLYFVRATTPAGKVFSGTLTCE